MEIIFNKESREFHLFNNNISYIIKLIRTEQPTQLYFGKKIKHRDDFSHMFQRWTERVGGLSANPFGDDETLSLDVVMQEYPSYGTTDFRQPAFQILQEDGSRITNFKYKSHKIFDGKNKLEGLPATYVENELEAKTLEIVLEDKLINSEMILSYTIFNNYDAITRNVKFVNNGETSLSLTRALSMCLDLPDYDYEMIHLSGTWTRERHIKTRKLEHGVQEIYSARGASSPHHNPFIALKRPNTDEFHGEVYGFNLVYSGNFLAQVEVDHYDVSRVLLGINPFDFSWKLEKGETFQTPEAVIVFSDNGLNGMSKVYHDLYRERLCRGKWRDADRPVLLNNWEATYFDFNEEKIVDIAKTAGELGVELFVLDDGWFGDRNDDYRALGDWFVNKDKLPNGITGLAKKINDMGLQFGLWFEPEMINKNSRLYEEHPDWLIEVKNRNNSPSRNQHILDFSRVEVVDYVYKMVADILGSANISYVKWDMNRNMTEIGSAGFGADRQMEVPHRYILGLYSMLEKLTSEFPNILFESCASGGGRFDPGMLYYMPQTWASDNSDAIERLNIQYGTSLVYPIMTMGAHVSAVPNHQLRRVTSLDTRANVAIFGAFGYELDLNTMDSYEKEVIKEQIKFYKENRSLIRTGDFYRLLSPFESNETAWMVVSKDKTEVVIGYYQVLSKSNHGFKTLKLQGLDEEIEYFSVDSDKSFFGDELMNCGYKFGHDIFNELGHKNTEEEIRKTGDFKSKIIRLVAKK